MDFTSEQVEFIFQLAEKLTGTSQQGTYRKEILVSNVKKRMNAVGMADLVSYLNFVKNDPDEKEWLISSLTIHTTSWFRENPHYEIIKKYIVDQLPIKKKFKIWSAACSTGEEVYTLGLIFAQLKVLYPDFDYEIVGSDIDPKSIQQAITGVYRADGLDSIPSMYHHNILMSEGVQPAVIKVDDQIRQRCRFLVHDLTSVNLLEGKDLFDIILCRNVLIYFKPDDVEKIVKNTLFKKLLPQGLLVLGHSEILDPSYKDQLKLLSRSCYLKLAKNAEPTNTAVVVSKSTRRKILVVDDSVTIRNSLRILLSKNNFDVTDVSSAAEATEEVKSTKFDLVTLDLNMPEENGLSWLKKQRQLGFKVPVVIISDSSPQEAVAIFGALENGAQDYIVKKNISHNPTMLLNLLEQIIDKSNIKSNLSISLKPFDLLNFKPEFILIGASTGGPQALNDLLINWPKPSPPVIIVQHITHEFASAFAQRLASAAGLSLAPMSDEPLELKQNTLYMSLSDYHLELYKQNNAIYVKKNLEEKMCGHRPSVSKVFLSAAKVNAKAISVILTGMGHDGADGVSELGKTEKCYSLVQDEKSCVVFGMPKKAIETNQVSFVGSIEQIRKELYNIIRR